MKKRISIVALIVSVSMSLCSCGLAKNVVKTAIKDNVKSEEPETESEVESEEEISSGIDFIKIDTPYEDTIKYELSGMTFDFPSCFNVVEETDSSMSFEYDLTDSTGIIFRVEYTEMENTISNENFLNHTKNTLDSEDTIENFETYEFLIDEYYAVMYKGISIPIEEVENGVCLGSMAYINASDDRKIYYILCANISTVDNSGNSDNDIYNLEDMLNTIQFIDSENDTSSESVSSEGVTPELKEFLDQYEAIMDEYVNYMQKIKSGNYNASDLLSGTTDILSKYNEFSQKVNDIDTSDMSKEDLDYYMDVTTRVSKKLLDVVY